MDGPLAVSTPVLVERHVIPKKCKMHHFMQKIKKNSREGTAPSSDPSPDPTPSSPSVPRSLHLWHFNRPLALRVPLTGLRYKYHPGNNKRANGLT